VPILRITSTRPLPPAYREMGSARGLQTVSSMTFPSMVLHREQSLLSEIQRWRRLSVGGGR